MSVKMNFIACIHIKKKDIKLFRFSPMEKVS